MSHQFCVGLFKFLIPYLTQRHLTAANLEIKDGKATMPKSEIKTLKQEYVQLKESMKSKKHEIVDLKKKIFDLKAEKRSHKQVSYCPRL